MPSVSKASLEAKSAYLSCVTEAVGIIGATVQKVDKDMEAAQVLGAAQSFLKTNDLQWHYAKTAEEHMPYFIRVCLTHSKRARELDEAVAREITLSMTSGIFKNKQSYLFCRQNRAIQCSSAAIQKSLESAELKETVSDLQAKLSAEKTACKDSLICENSLKDELKQLAQPKPQKNSPREREGFAATFKDCPGSTLKGESIKLVIFGTFD
ncbi:hypothetical protein CVT24_013208 [Panaeolus cyanescens]|uniref:Uncharacterized protein n=1 Tax=Panaeolus cyanescens TaxID=181874 RepID=A0A409YMV3_9AGAR|nr:hypothetical protein CVT24_013208 [Panaeolus cyanescens]